MGSFTLVLTWFILATASQASADQEDLKGVGEKLSFKIFVQGNERVVSFELNKDGEAVYQGDIILAKNGKAFAAKIRELTNKGKNAIQLQDVLEELNLFGLVTRSEKRLWPLGRINFHILSSAPNHQKIRDAIAHWVAKTDIEFIEIVNLSDIASDTDVVVFALGLGCGSSIGRLGGMQPVRVTKKCSFGNIVHEIGHLVGLMHEQARSDRDGFITVLDENIEEGKSFNFSIDAILYKNSSDYCYGSVMHYGSDYFSVPKGATTLEINLPPGSKNTIIGQRDGLAECDIKTVTKLYESEISKR